MQSNKASKKTRKIAEESAVATPEKATGVEKTAKPRASRSSKAKKPEVSDAVSANHHHKPTSSAVQDLSVGETSPDTKTFAVGAGAGSASSEAAILDAAGVVAPPTETTRAMEAAALEAAPSRTVSPEEIAQLAHSYWVARGYVHGYAEEDWLRAERELNAKR